MDAVAIDAYSIAIRERRKTKPALLGAFDGKTAATVALKPYLSVHVKRHLDISLLQKCISVEPLDDSKSSLRGLLWVGQYGQAGNLIDAKKGSLSYKKKKFDADMVPYFFNFYLPPKATKGILLSQRFGLGGIRSILEFCVQTPFEEDYPGYKLDIHPLMPSQALAHLINKGRISEVRFVKYNIPSDIADRFNGKKTKEDGEIEFVVRPKKTGFLSSKPLLKIVSAITSHGGSPTPMNDILELDNFEYDNLKAQIDFEGRKRMINFGRLGRLKGSFDVSDDVHEGPDGFPTYDSLCAVGNGLAADLASQLGLHG